MTQDLGTDMFLSTHSYTASKMEYNE